MLVACCFSLSLPSYMRFNPNSSVSCVAAALNIFLLTPVNKRKIIFCHKLTNKPLCEYMFTTAKGIPSAIIMGISVMTIIWFYSYPINSLAILIQPVYLFIYNYAVLFTPFYRPSELFLFQNHYTPDNLFIYPLISLFLTTANDSFMRARSQPPLFTSHLWLGFISWQVECYRWFIWWIFWYR